MFGEYDTVGAEIKSYGWLPDSSWGTDPLFMKDGDQYYWYLNDHLGTPQQMINCSGQVVWSAVYDAFGQASVEVESVVSNLRFPGQYYDSETGLHYNWNRYYDPGTGRYLTPDPIGLAGGLNLFAYVGGDPVNSIDPDGLRKIDIIDLIDKAKKGGASLESKKCKGFIEDLKNVCKSCSSGDCMECTQDVLCPFSSNPDLCVKFAWPSCFSLCGNQ
ncbi:MAG: RHS domain-containing protein [Proteobacteria bacterium]|nr:RHS domain-containing protein [Pseudomonadota bacterium]MBU1715135.1 RHS domain-containing protein [Pseudomonadota bacterium]